MNPAPTIDEIFEEARQQLIHDGHHVATIMSFMENSVMLIPLGIYPPGVFSEMARQMDLDEEVVPFVLTGIGIYEFPEEPQVTYFIDEAWVLNGEDRKPGIPIREHPNRREVLITHSYDWVRDTYDWRVANMIRDIKSNNLIDAVPMQPDRDQHDERGLMMLIKKGYDFARWRDAP